MKELPPASDDFVIITTFYSFADLWNQITFSYLLRHDIACLPFKLNGRFWTVALKSDYNRKIWGDR